MSTANRGRRIAIGLYCFCGLLFTCFVGLLVGSEVQASWMIRLEEARTALSAGSFNRAEDILRSALATLPDRTTLPAVLLWNEIGTVHQALGKLSEAERDYQHALEMNQFQPDSHGEGGSSSAVEMAISLNNLGAIAEKRQQFAAAEARFRRALQLIGQAPGKDNPTLGSILSNLAAALKQQGRLAEAESFYSAALQHYKEGVSKNGIEQARLLTKFGFFQYETGHYQQALEMAGQADRIELSLPNTSGFDRAATLNTLGLALFNTGHWSEAESAFRGGLDLRSANSSDDSRVAELLTNLAVLKKRQGRLAEAQDDIGKGLRIAERVSPRDDVLIVKIWANQGAIAVAQKRYREGSNLLHKAANYFVKSGRSHDPNYSSVLSLLADLEQKRHHYKRAETLYRQALESDEAALGPDNLKVASDLSNVGAELCFQKNCEQAIPFYQRAEGIQEANLGPNSLEVARTWRQLGLVYLNLKQFGEADQVYQRAIRIWNATGQNNSEVMHSLREYAYVCRKRDRFGDAEQAEVQALRIEVRKAIEADKEPQQVPPTPVKGFRSGRS